MQNLASLFSKLSLQFQIASEFTSIVLVFKRLSIDMWNTMNVSFYLKQRRNAPFSIIAFKLFLQFQLPNHRFILRHNAPVSVLALKVLGAFPTSKTSFQIASEGTVYPPWFQFFLRSSNFQNIVSNSVRRHRLDNLISNWITNSGTDEYCGRRQWCKIKQDIYDDKPSLIHWLVYVV